MRGALAMTNLPPMNLETLGVAESPDPMRPQGLPAVASNNARVELGYWFVEISQLCRSRS